MGGAAELVTGTGLTRENLSSVEQLAKSAQLLSRQAVDLSTLVGQFKMD